MAPKVETTRDQDLKAVQEHVQGALPDLLHRADQLIERSEASQGLNQQVSETIEASRQLMRLGPREVDSLAAQVKRVAQATKKLEEAERSSSSGAAYFRKWVGM